MPAVLGFSADLIATGGKAWIKSSLSPDGKYHTIDLGSLTSGLPLPSLPAVASPDPSAMASVLDPVRAELDKLPAPTKLADEKIGDQDTYHVQWKVTSADLPQARAGERRRRRARAAGCRRARSRSISGRARATTGRPGSPSSSMAAPPAPSPSPST